MKLYYSPGACSLAVHIVLKEIGLDFELIKVNLGAKTLPDGSNFLAINPRGQVPTLEIDDGTIITEGVAINQYLADIYREKNLAPSGPSIERSRLNGLLNFISSEYHKAFSPLFDPRANDDVKQYTIMVLKSRLEYVNNLLADGREFVFGNSFTIADAYLFTVSRWVNYVGLNLGEWKNIENYVQKIGARQSCIDAINSEV